MTKTTESQLHPVPPVQARDNRSALDAIDFGLLNDVDGGGTKLGLRESEKELLRELVYALRTIRYGSIALTVHEGQLVEINKSIRIRKGRTNQKD
jgi:hypothetical protein